MGEVYILVGIILGLVGEYSGKSLTLLIGVIFLVGGSIIRRMNK